VTKTATLQAEVGAPLPHRPDEGTVQIGVQIAAGAMVGVDVRICLYAT
jgi:hypothetical protein